MVREANADRKLAIPESVPATAEEWLLYTDEEFEERLRVLEEARFISKETLQIQFTV